MRSSVDKNKKRLRNDSEVVDPEIGQRQRNVDQPLSPWKSTKRWLFQLIYGLISAGFAAYFFVILYSESLAYFESQLSGPDAIVWLAFLALNIAVCALFWIYLLSGYSGMMISWLSLLVNVWALVYIVMVWMGKQETIHFYTVAASVGMVSSLYHSLMVGYCIEKPLG
jgi:fatty acid desaturase